MVRPRLFIAAFYVASRAKAWGQKARIGARVPAAHRSLVTLAMATAASAAVLAHGTIDIIADYLVAHASYDDVSGHASRALVCMIAAAIAAVVALHRLRLCCEAAASRKLTAAPAPSWRGAPFFVGATVLLASFAVPLMELFDSRLAGTTLADLGDAFGGSLLLGLGTTIACATALGIAVFALARWILSHRDRIIAAIAEIIHFRWQVENSASRRSRRFGEVPICRRSISALRRGTRAPPHDALLSHRNIALTLGGHPCYLHFLPRAA